MTDFRTVTLKDEYGAPVQFQFDGNKLHSVTHLGQTTARRKIASYLRTMGLQSLAAKARRLNKKGAS